MEKKLTNCGEILESLDSWRLQDCKDALDSPQEPVAHLQTQQEALTGLSIANLNFSEIAFSVGYLHKVSLEFSFQAIDQLVCSRCTGILVICNPRNSNLSFQIQVLRSWASELTTLDGQ